MGGVEKPTKNEWVKEDEEGIQKKIGQKGMMSKKYEVRKERSVETISNHLRMSIQDNRTLSFMQALDLQIDRAYEMAGPSLRVYAHSNPSPLLNSRPE